MGRSAPAPIAPIPSLPERRRKCPECAELILVDAKVCKHCGYRLSSAVPVIESYPKTVVNCPLCAAEQRIPKGAPRFRCGKCRETVDSPI
ncbi:zinc ribbon domain-containing protein [Mycolicibacterium sp. BiH015]|uniref:zinc ribbon domain-containing protein n=1 Tax=Mycolicibacterium sp. BiH015 TaxID=3018808 RepID=UPI003FA5CF16